MKNHLIHVVVLFVVFSFNLFAQYNPEDSTVSVVAYWSPGDKYTFEINSESYTVIGNDTSQYQSITGLLDISVVDSTDTTYISRWDTYGFVIEGESTPIIDALKNIDTIRYLIQTDEVGTFEDLLNWEEIRDTVESVLDNIYTAKFENDSVKAIFDDIMQNFKTKEAILASAISEVQTLLFFHGYAFEMGKEYSSEYQVPNFITGDPVKILQTNYLDEIMEEEGLAILKSYMVADSTDLNYSVRAMIGEMAKKAGKEFNDTTPLPIVSREEYVGNALHYDSGWIVNSYYELVVKALKYEKYNIISIQML